MKPPIILFRVVGIRANGDLTILSTNSSLSIAEKAISLMRVGSDYKELFIESNGDGAGPWKRQVK